MLDLKIFKNIYKSNIKIFKIKQDKFYKLQSYYIKGIQLV